MARLYANENFPLDCVVELRGLGHDVLTVQDSGRGGCDDKEVLAYAAGENRAVVTFNRRHFITLHNLHAAHAGIIVCSFDATSRPWRVASTPLSPVHQLWRTR
jgi:hypothetical protein